MKRRFSVLFGVALVASGLAGCRDGAPGGGRSAAQIIAQAPSFQIILDISSSSPALDQGIMSSVAPQIVETLKAMPPGTLVTVSTVGDATVAASLLRMQIQTRGTTASDVARKLHRFLLDFPAQAKSRVQVRSDLVGGFAAAAADIFKSSSISAAAAPPLIRGS